MKKIGKEIIINILLTIVLYLNVVLVEWGLRLALGRSVLEMSAYIYDLSYVLMIAWILWVVPSVKLKSMLVGILTLLFDVCCFVMLMKIQNDIFFVLLKNDMGMLICQIMLLVVPFIITSIVTYGIYWLSKTHDTKIRYTFCCSVLVMCSGTFGNTLIHDTYKKEYETVKYSTHTGYIDKYRHSLDDYDVIERLGVFRYAQTCYENYKFSLRAHMISDSDRELAYSFVDNHKFVASKNNMSGVFEGKNLIMVLCESLDDSVINEKLMPNIYKISKEGINFSNHYSPLYKYHTSDSEFMSQTGMYPSQQFGSTYKNFYTNDFPYALGNLFKGKGYLNQAYHAFYGYFYNRDVMLEHLGFDKFYDAGTLDLDVPKNALSGIVGFYEDEKLMDDMLSTTDTSGPFYNLMLMLSGHSAYLNERGDIQNKLDIINTLEEYKEYPDEAKNYMAAQMLLDDSIGYLVEELENRGILEDTVICLFSDHYPYGLGTDGALELLVGNDKVYSKHKTMWMIYNPCVEHVEYTDVTSTFDIYPTLANMFNLDISNAYVVGHDVFNNESDNYVLFEDGSLLSDEYYYNFSDDSFYDLQGNKIEAIKDDIYLKTREVIRSGQDVLRSDVYHK